MWTRQMLKDYAKQELKYSYWLSLLVCFVAGILGGGSTGGSGIQFRNTYSSSSGSGGFDGFDGFGSFPFGSVFIIAILVAVLIGIVFGLALSIFVANPIRAGMCSFFIRAPYGDRQFSHLFSSFKSGRYMSIVKTMFMTNIYIFLWSLLFIVPGVIKGYQYRMVPYIICEDPSLTPQQAMDLSKRMTDGEKFDMWVLDLSFIGWYILGTLALFIGVLFVTPYVEATQVQLYFVLRHKVLAPPQNPPYPGY